jgi:hypothetical protein
MSVQNVSTNAQALASYTAQAQSVHARDRAPENPPKPRDTAQNPPAADRVTLSAQANKPHPTQNAGNPATAAQAAHQVQANNPQVAHSMASKSVTQALEAYVKTSLI